MAKDRQRNSVENEVASHRNPNLLAHYHECASRVFYNGGRANEYLHNLFLKAAKNGEIERVQNFLKRSSRNHNVNVDFKDKKTGNTAIVVAAQGNHTKIVKLLLNYGADITLLNDKGQSVIELVPEPIRHILLASVERQGVSHRHLLQAAWQGNVDVLRRLLSSQANLNVNCKNADGMTPLLLVTRDINLFEKIEKVVSEKGYHPVEVMKELLLHKADSNMTGSDGKTALHHVACNKGKMAEEMANLIINNKDSHIEKPDQSNCLPIHFASREDNCPVLLALINGGADVNVRGINGQTPLHMAAVYGHERSSSALLDNGADVTIVNDNGFSPVEVATSKKAYYVLQEAWSKQTHGKSSRKSRSFSAPNQHKTVKDMEATAKPTATVKVPSPRRSSSPSPPTENTLNASESRKMDNGDRLLPRSPLPKKQKTMLRSQSFTTKGSSLVPSPPKSSYQRTESRPQKRQISSRSQESAIHTQDRFELPKLSVKNIELQFSSSPRQDFSYYSNNIQRVRLLTPGHCSRSLPATPTLCNTYRHSNRGIAVDGISQNMNKIRMPTKIAPLTGQRPVTPEQTIPHSTVLSDRSLECTGQVVDLDFLQNNSKCITSLEKLYISTDVADERSLLQPPSSPCDDGTPNIEGNSHDVNSHDVNSHDVNKNEVQSERTEEQNLHHTGCKETSKNTEKEIKGRNENMDETKSESKTEINEPDFDRPDIYQTQTFSSSDISHFWIPNMKDNKDNINDKYELEKEAQDNETRITSEMEGKTNKQERRESTSVSFYVDFKSVINHAQCSSCNSQLENKDSQMCVKCEEQTRSQRKTFWISMDGETSDGEAETPTAAQKLRYGHEKDVTSVHRRKSKSLPATSQPSVPFHVTTECMTNVSNCSKEIKDEDLKLHCEGTFVIDSNPEEDPIKDDNQAAVQIDQKAGTNSNCINTKETTEFVNQYSNYTISDKENINNEDVPNNTESSIVLQSVNTGGNKEDELQIEKKKDELPRNNNTESLQNEKTDETLRNIDSQYIKNKDEIGEEIVDGPKSAWSSEAGVQICNAFPSPIPPKNTPVKPDVQPPIGENFTKTKQRKTGKKGRKNSGTESKKAIRTQNKKTSGNDPTKKGKKGKSKKKEESFKEISVNQSGPEVACMIETEPKPGDISVGVPSPDVDHAPTLSIDSRTLSCKMLKKMFPVLSPIPESPHSCASTPRSIDLRSQLLGNKLQTDCSQENLENPKLSEIHMINNCTEQAVLNSKSVDNYENIASNSLVEGDDTEGRENSVTDSSSTQHDHGDNDIDNGYDEADGGMISRFIGMCIPRLNLNNSNSDSEEEIIQNEENITKENDNDDNDSANDDEDDSNSAKDNAISTNDDRSAAIQEAQCRSPEEEINEDIEDIVQEILKNTNDPINFKNDLIDAQTDMHNGKVCKTEEKPPNTTDPREVEITRQKNVKKSFKQRWTMNYISEMHRLSQSDFEEHDEVFLPNEAFDHNVSSNVSLEDVLSDDSSYISCDSTPRGTSECSTFESSDSVLSSRDSTRENTFDDSTPCGSYGTVDIKVHERNYKSSNTSSSDTRSTLSNNSVVSAQTFIPSNSQRFVRSQVSVNSLSSDASCGEEIQWQKGNILGKGGFGTVWLGLVKTSGEMIAVKQVELNHNDDSEAEKQYEKLQEEVSLLKSLRHQNIVKYIGTCLDDNFVVNIFMEFVPGGSIAQALKRFGAFVEPVFQRYTKQILSGVDYLHTNNVIHRDIKGGNIMLMPDGVIKLIDFGCAKRLCMNMSVSRSSMLHSIKGTPYWMAPEVIKETGHGTKSDIWSIGCTVYEMAIGSPPWSDMKPMAAIFSIGNGSQVPELGESFSQLARDFTSACMTRDPETRPSASQLLRHKFLRNIK